MNMWQEIIVILILLVTIGYVVGKVISFFKSLRSKEAHYCSGCSGCQVKNSCTKPEV